MLMGLSAMSARTDRVHYLRAQIDRLKAELCAVEDGSLEFIEGAGIVVASELAEALSVSRTAANNRLRRLEEVGILVRRRHVLDGGGAVWCYQLADNEVHRG